MIEITRPLARQIRTMMRKSVPRTSAQTFRSSLAFLADQTGLHVRGQHPEVAVEYHLPGARPGAMIVLPTTALNDFEGSQDLAVTLTQKNRDVVEARWEDHGVHQCREYGGADIERLPAFPVEPKKPIPLDASFLKAFDDVAQTAGRNNLRSALTRLLLRGKAGEIVSTDARQLLIQRGFRFPWKEDVLIPSTGVFGCRELTVHEGPFTIGRTETHVCIRRGGWRFFLAIDKDARYPRVEQIIPSPSSQSTTFHIAPEDALFLVRTLSRWPGRDEENAPITLDLNGQVAIRVREEGQSPATEWLLCRSKFTGPSMLLVANRQFLTRALRLGFTDFHVASPDRPIVARDRHRLYVWAPHNQEAAIPPSADAIRIESTKATEALTPAPPPSRSTKIMPAPPANGHAAPPVPTPRAGGDERPQTLAELIGEAEQLRNVMLDASSRLSRLLSGLKQQRRKSRAMQTAMQSLKQLKLDG